MSWTKNIQFRHSTCYDYNGKNAEFNDNVIDVYIVTTRQCNAACKFCEYHTGNINLDTDWIIEAFKELSRTATVGTIHFTGGETTLGATDKMVEICTEAKKIFPLVKTSVNTNGSRLKDLEDIDVLDNIALSRHHYDDEVNNSIFGIKTADTETLNSFNDKHKLHLSCNLIKGYIDSEEEIRMYLEYVSKLGVCDIGLVSLMKINKYCEEYYVDFNKLDLKRINNLKRTRWYCNSLDKTSCSCRCENYLYMAENYNLLSVYHRQAIKLKGIEEISNYLVFEDKKIMQGFNGAVLNKL